MLVKIYVVIGAVLLLFFAVATFTGVELGNPDRQFVPADVRNSPGGYRSFHFWHFGYHGGK
ncbi:MAG TPA: hypothetical protein VFV34_01945 [Blastocatellia bacterium]|nr:hypothetical protein [Blastocatellia bacterium]